jgi:hypothetical protein
MLLTLEIVRKDGALLERSSKMKFFCNGVEYREITAIDTDVGYLDYYAKHKGDFVVVNDRALVNRIFGECRIEEK